MTARKQKSLRIDDGTGAVEAPERPRAVTLDADDPEALMDGLRARLIELELQNADLRAIQEELEHTHRLTSERYAHAPVGLFVLDKDGLILQANETGGDMLGLERRRLVRKPFIFFVTRERLNEFRGRCREAILTRQRVHCEIIVRPRGGEPFPARISLLGARDGESETPVCHAALIESLPGETAHEEATHGAYLQEPALATSMAQSSTRASSSEASIARAANVIISSITGIGNVFLLLRGSLPHDHECMRYLPIVEAEFKRIREALRTLS